MSTQLFAPGGYRYHPRRVPILRRRRGRARLSHRARHLPQSRAAGARLRARRRHHQGTWPAADRLLRLRAEVARALHRCRLSRLQRGLRRDAQPVGHLRSRQQDQPGRAQQRLPRDRPAGRALVPRLLLHGGERGEDADLRGGRQRRGQRGWRQLSRAHRPLRARPAPMRCARRRSSCSARWSVA